MMNPSDFLTALREHTDSETPSAPASAETGKKLRTTDLANYWQVSKSYVSQLKSKRGMPDFTTFAAADTWRELNAPPMRKRGRRTAQKNDAKANHPPVSEDTDDWDIELQDGDFDEIMIRHAEEVPQIAFNLYKNSALNRDPGAVANHLRNWSEAAKQAAAVRERFLAVQEKNGELLHLDLVMNIVGSTIGGIRSGLARLPGRCAAAANPENPELAQREIEREIDRLLELVHPAADHIEQELIATAEIEKPSPTPDERTNREQDS